MDYVRAVQCGAARLDRVRLRALIDAEQEYWPWRQASIETPDAKPPDEEALLRALTTPKAGGGG